MPLQLSVVSKLKNGYNSISFTNFKSAHAFEKSNWNQLICLLAKYLSKNVCRFYYNFVKLIFKYI